ncbi:MAG: tryptophan 7-halogenase [Gammaproteobacteria bacterium]|nr:tryptophan 7-halogenase [Gammaproteobacteria bacterium]MBU2072550.1 tryptophan 7-halogenase [Gammaproteobacteria bacterium]MBU2184080.1 tryptophan 7-halogenase [Gammaproteobacteria bacterium]MBU2206834.1 tryptophan 7-halogenase [Gammaproteobacteria bacterium]
MQATDSPATDTLSSTANCPSSATGAVNIVVLGGGSAGWLTAALLAADHQSDPLVTISLIESATLPAIGVGEGTWPSMRATLARIGISETEFLLSCDASFKQGSVFRQWRTASAQDCYYHPFTAPVAANELDIAEHWFGYQQHVEFAAAVSSQPAVIAAGLAPKRISTPEYAFLQNYGYHLDAAKFVDLLSLHAKRLGVQHIVDDVVAVQSHADGRIAALQTAQHGNLSGDLFVDCSGLPGLLIGQHYQTPLLSVQHCLLNDSALAVQVAYDHQHTPIASATLATAQTQGWVWDIGLPSRRGVGFVHHSGHTNEQQARATLAQYLRISEQELSERYQARLIRFTPGYRQQFWRHNCVAVGMAAGFIEPLEASALVMVELSAKFISEQLPRNPAQLAIVAERFNQTFSYRWQQIVEFLKLHYVLSNRHDSDYWLAQRAESSIPSSLQEKLMMWRQFVPSRYDLPQAEELFPAASYQYILYGMRQLPASRPPLKAGSGLRAQQAFTEVKQKTQQLRAGLVSNRELLNQIKAHGLQKI